MKPFEFSKKNDDGSTVIVGQIFELGKPNVNNRIYTKEAIEGALKKNICRKKIDSRSMLGGIIGNESQDEPASLSTASHLVTEIWIEEDSVMAELQVLETANGKSIIKAIKENKIIEGASFGKCKKHLEWMVSKP